ncbi:MAG: hypothetical protein ACLQPN_02645 [Bryobacteraceae bacterium]
MRALAGFCVAVSRHWGSLVTGGVIIGALGIWQGTGHSVHSWVYTVVAGCGFVIAFFKAWSDQSDRAERAERRIVELQGRPDVSLTLSTLEGQEVFDPAKMKSERGTTGRAVFIARNNGPGQAVNMSIDDIVLPMSDCTQSQILEQEKAFRAQMGEEISIRKPGWNQWTVLFESLTSVGQGQEVEIPYRIDNMGPLQNRDICYCLCSTVRAADAGPLRLPIVLRFSNRDGSTWAQIYDMEHRFMRRIALTFRRVEFVTGEKPD